MQVTASRRTCSRAGKHAASSRSLQPRLRACGVPARPLRRRVENNRWQQQVAYLWYRYPDTEVWSTAKVRRAICMRSKGTLFQMYSTVQSTVVCVGTCTPAALKVTHDITCCAGARPVWPIGAYLAAPHFYSDLLTGVCQAHDNAVGAVRLGVGPRAGVPQLELISCTDARKLSPVWSLRQVSSIASATGMKHQEFAGMMQPAACMKHQEVASAARLGTR